MTPVTIGIPFYNAEPYLADAIRSVMVQTHRDWELLLVDDGSTDRSLEIARSIRDSRVRVLTDGTNRRLSYRLNQITAEAQHDLIARMDADDLMSPRRLEKQIAVLESSPDVDFVSTGVCVVSRRGQPIGLRVGRRSTTVTARGLIYGDCVPVHATTLGRKFWFKRNPYDTVLARAQDRELWLQAFSKNDLRFSVIDEPLYYYREELNLTLDKLLTAHQTWRLVVWRYKFLGLGRWELVRALLQSHVKSMMFRALSVTGRLERILDRRHTPFVDAASRQHLVDELALITNAELPTGK